VRFSLATILAFASRLMLCGARVSEPIEMLAPASDSGRVERCDAAGGTQLGTPLSGLSFTEVLLFDPAGLLTDAHGNMIKEIMR